MEVSVIEEITNSIASLDGSISARRNHKEHSKFGWSPDGSISDRRNHKQQVWMEVSVIEEITNSKFGWKYQW